MNLVKVSVVIPVKNRLKSLTRALTSVLHQKEQDFEVLIVDNASESSQQAAKLAGQFDERFKFLVCAEGNANAARNMGVEAAQGNYIAFLDSDDEWLPDHLTECLREIKEQSVDLIYGGAQINNGQKIWAMKSWQKRDHQSMLSFYFDGGTAPTPSLFGRTECIKQVRWDQSLNRHQDYDFCIRFSQQFSLGFKKEITVTIHWLESEKRGLTKTDIDKFVNKHGLNNNQLFHNRYFLKICADRAWENDEVRKYILREIWRYPRYSSFVRYKDTLKVNTKKQEFLLRLYYSFKICFG